MHEKTLRITTIFFRILKNLKEILCRSEMGLRGPSGLVRERIVKNVNTAYSRYISLRSPRLFLYLWFKP
jgi:hypothetical protein